MFYNSFVYFILIIPSFILILKGLKGFKNGEVWRPISSREYDKMVKRGVGTWRTSHSDNFIEKQIFGHAAKNWSITYLSIGVICLMATLYLFVNNGPILLFFFILISMILFL